jgi:S-adenosylmethionine hydrolase
MEGVYGCDGRQKKGNLHEPLISLITDFGVGPDEAVYAIKSAIRYICPRARIEDICHNVPLGTRLIAAWRLARVAGLETERLGTIYVAIVDPGVGSIRRSIAVRATDGSYFVGPDNGVLSLALDRQGIQQAVHITNDKYTLRKFAKSSTFDGKDVFGPIAAHIAVGVPLEEFGAMIEPESLVRINFDVEQLPYQRIGVLTDIDGFGTLRTTISNHLPETLIGNKLSFNIIGPGIDINSTARLSRTFAECEVGEPLLILASTGALDLAVNLGNASKKFGIRPEQIDLGQDLRPTIKISVDLREVSSVN